MDQAGQGRMNGDSPRQKGHCYIDVLLPLPLARSIYTYIAPVDTKLLRGQLVCVPFLSRTMWGIVWDAHRSTPPDCPLERLKPIDSVSDAFAFSHHTLAFVEKFAAYTLAPLGKVLKLFLSSPDLLASPGPRSLKIVQQDLLTSAEEIVLTQEQSAASMTLLERVHGGTFSVTLLEGITGSGKTEVYLTCLEPLLRQKKQILVLLPEIVLTSQWVQRFEKYFGFQPAVWHAGLTPAKRRVVWQGVHSGEISVVVGARSALFLPFKTLGLVIVDEEHEPSYKQEEGGCYHGRDMAILRASIEHIPVILASATPSLETLWNVQEKRYAHVLLSERYLASLPKAHVIHTKPYRQSKATQNEWVTPPLRQALRETLERDEQSLLYLNRRGYTPLLLCHACGEASKCPTCDVTLVFHKKTHQVCCHYCGYKRSLFRECPSCHHEGDLRFLGPGIERIVEEVTAFLPQARIGVMSSDHTTTPLKIQTMLEALRQREIDIVIGTQMIAKGHDFPGLTCVGVIDADHGMDVCDFRSSERVYQRLTQVMGRAGRGEQKGSVWIQTMTPEHPALTASVAQERVSWLDQEWDERERHLWPPFGRLVALILSSPSHTAVERYAAQLLCHTTLFNEEIEVLGPVPAPHAVLRRRHRVRFLIRSPRSILPQKQVQHWLNQVPCPANVRVEIDVDPQTFL